MQSKYQDQAGSFMLVFLFVVAGRCCCAETQHFSYIPQFPQEGDANAPSSPFSYYTTAQNVYIKDGPMTWTETFWYAFSQP